MHHDDDKRGPGLRFPPPLLMVVAVGGGYLAGWIKPLPIMIGNSLWLTGIALIVISVTLALLALFHFLEAKTHVEPWHPTTTIINKGLFRFSRNPIYLAFCLATVGCGLLLNSWWVLASVCPLAYLLQQLVIKREEAYLEKKFGKTYLEYKNKVRRWL